MSSPLPEYERPPVEEVAIGVQFEPPAKLRAPHFGRYWSKIRERYPHAEEQPPLLSQLEQEDPKAPARAIFTGIPLRCWFLDASGNELIQLQRDRFLTNWRQIKGDERYPRFANLMKTFKEEWARFLEFLAEDSLGQAHVNQCELSYVNNLEPGRGWKDYADLEQVFTVLRASRPGFLPPPELQSWEARYKLPDKKGRLYVETHPVLRARDLKLAVAFSLTARGAPGAATADSIFAWFDLAHEWIVRGFDQLTQPAMHALWGKK